MTEAEQVLTHLAGGAGRHAAVERKTARDILLETGGETLVEGRLRRIVVEELGAGVYRLSLEAQPAPGRRCAYCGGTGLSEAAREAPLRTPTEAPGERRPRRAPK